MRNVSLACLLLGFAFLLMSCRTPELEAPAVPFGPGFGFLDSTCQYAVVATDLGSEPVAARFCWGHDDTSDWTGLVPHGDTIRLDHTWQKYGTHEVRAQFRDQSSRQSGWSDPLVVYVAEFDFPSRIVGSNDEVGSWDIELSPDEEHLWIGSVFCCYVVETRTMTKAATIHLPPRSAWSNLAAVAVMPDGRHAYATSYRDDWLAVIRTSDYAIVDTIPFCQVAHVAALSPDGKYLYTVGDVPWSDEAIQAIRTDVNTVVDSLALEGNDWVRLAMTPNGDRMYAMRYCARHVQQIQAPGLAMADIISFDSEWTYGMALTPDGEHLYAVGRWSEWGESGPAIIEVRTDDDSIVRVLHVEDSLCGNEFTSVLPSPDGRYLYVGGDDLYVFRVSDLAHVHTIRTPGRTVFDMEVTAAGDRVYLVHYDGGPLLAIGY